MNMPSEDNAFVRVLKSVRLFNKYFRAKRFVDWNLYHKYRLREFDNIHAGESCFIIGNGPSLNKMDLSLLKRRTCFGLNKIYMHPDVDKIGINYHVAVNSLVIEQSLNNFASLNCPSFISYNACKGHRAESSLSRIIWTGLKPVFSPNPYSLVGEGSTVTYVALQLAYFMGFSKVFLIGVDHNFVVDGEPHEKQKLEGSDINHFHPDYFSGQDWHLPDLVVSEESYKIAREYFKQNGRQIYDATVDGKLNVFPKIGYHEALELYESRDSMTAPIQH